jgi:dihydrofolate reductase
MNHEPNPSAPAPAESSVRWIAVAAMAENRVIGREGGLPWHLPGDLRFFRDLTTGGTVLMGRRTFEAIGRALPRRRNLVVSRGQPDLPEGVELVRDLRAVPEYLRGEEAVFVIGGARLYEQTLPWWTEVYLTLVPGAYEGDALMPSFEERFGPPERVRAEEQFTVYRYGRPAAGAEGQ